MGDVVREAGGESKTGTILHIHRSYIFMHNRTQLENSGLWTTRTTNVITTAIKGGRAPGSGPDLSKMNPALQLRNGGANGGMAPPRTMGRDPLQGKQVKIKRGPYKGNIGLVKDTTDSGARIELQAKNKIVNVEKEHLMIIEYVRTSHKNGTTANVICSVQILARPSTSAPFTALEALQAFCGLVSALHLPVCLILESVVDALRLAPDMLMGVVRQDGATHHPEHRLGPV